MDVIAGFLEISAMDVNEGSVRDEVHSDEVGSTQQNSEPLIQDPRNASQAGSLTQRWMLGRMSLVGD